MSDELNKHIASLMESDLPETGNEEPGQVLADEVEPAPQIPPDVIDEQAESWDSAKERQPEEPEQDYRALYEQEQKAKGGLLSEVHKLRDKLSNQSNSIEQLRQIFLQKEQEEYERQLEAERLALMDEEAQVYGEDVVNDPAVRYMRDKWAQTQDLIERQNQEAEGRRRAILEASQRHRAQQAAFEAEVNWVRGQEESFKKEHPDYEDAYEYAKRARVEMYQDMGFDPDAAVATVRQEEYNLRQVAKQKGGNVAEAIWKLAQRYGYESKPKDGEPAPKTRGPEPLPNFNKMKQGVKSRGLSGMPGAGGSSSGGARKLSAEEFYATVPLGRRLEIQADPDKFEELGRTGYITID